MTNHDGGLSNAGSGWSAPSGKATGYTSNDFDFSYQGKLTPAEKAEWSKMSPTEQRDFNTQLGLPAGAFFSYNHAEPGWKEAFSDALNPTGKGILSAFMRDMGVRGAGVTADQYTSNETDQQRDKRMGMIGEGIDRVGNFAINMMPGGGLMMNGARAINAMQNEGMSGWDALKSAALDIGGNYIAGPINKAIGGAVGEVGRKAISDYGMAQAVAGLISPGSLPAFKPGQDIVRAAAKQFGVTGLPNARPETNTPDGNPVVTRGGLIGSRR